MKIGFIGGGNMAKAMIKGIISSGEVSPEHIIVSDIQLSSLDELYSQGVKTTSDNSAVVQSQFVVLAVKPQVYEWVIREISPLLKADTVIITIAPGWTLAKLQQALGRETKIIRTMPNTPAMVSSGMTALCKNEFVAEEELAYVSKLFSGFSRCEVIPEKLMDVAGAVSGSSPAFVFMFIEALADGAVAEGMSRQQAYNFAAQAVMGSAKLVLESGNHPGKLKDMVCSPAGTTIEGVQSLEENNFRGAVMQAVRACVKKSHKLAE